MKEKGIGQGGGGVRGGGGGEKAGGLVVTALASVATAGTHGGIQYFTLN